MPSDLSPQDRDLVTRTILGEAGGESDEALAAVASVVKNRVASGRYGDTAGQVVLQRGQFEPWQTRRRELMGYSTKSPDYQRAARIVDGVFGGDVPDLSGGATHFFDPKAQAALGRRPPDWGRGKPLASVGPHLFFAPEGRVEPENGIDAIRAAIGASPAEPIRSALAFEDAKQEAPGATGLANPTKSAPAPAATPAVGSLFRDAGFTLPVKGVAPTQAPAPAEQPSAAPQPAAGSLFRDAGFSLPGETPAAPVPPAPTPVPGAPPEVPMSTGTGWAPKAAASAPPSPPTVAQALDPRLTIPFADRIHAIREGTAPETVVPAAGKAWWNATADNFQGSEALAAQGVHDIFSSQPATGIGRVGLGALGMAGSPISGAVQAGVEEPVTALTGDPEIGKRAALLAGIGVPGPKVAATARAARPSNQAVDMLVHAIGPENVPDKIAQLRSNPRLSVMDVSDPVRTMAQGIAANPAQPEAQRVVTGAVNARQSTLPAATNTAYTEAMGPAPNVVQMVEGLKERAREVGRNAIRPALDGAKPVDVSPVVAAIDAEVKPGIQAMLDPGTRLPLSPRQEELLRLRNQLVNPETGEMLTDANRLHEIQSRAGDKAFQFQRSGDGWSRDVGNGLRDANEKLIDAIDTAAGGAYRPARQKFKDAADIHRAFDAGFDTLKNRQGVPGLEDRPEAFQDWMDKATPEEVVARRLGTRSDIDQKIRGVKNQALAGQNITAIEYNRDKLRMLFGDEEANRLIQTMEDAQLEARTNAKITEGSKTAETLSGKEALEVRPVKPFELRGGGAALLPGVAAEVGAYLGGLPPGIAGPALLGAAFVGAAARKAASSLANRVDVARNVAFARHASSTGEARERTIEALASHPEVIGALQKRANLPATP